MICSLNSTPSWFAERQATVQSVSVARHQGAARKATANCLSAENLSTRRLAKCRARCSPSVRFASGEKSRPAYRQRAARRGGVLQTSLQLPLTNPIIQLLASASLQPMSKTVAVRFAKIVCINHRPSSYRHFGLWKLEFSSFFTMVGRFSRQGSSWYIDGYPEN